MKNISLDYSFFFLYVCISSFLTFIISNMLYFKPFNSLQVFEGTFVPNTSDFEFLYDFIIHANLDNKYREILKNNKRAKPNKHRVVVRIGGK